MKNSIILILSFRPNGIIFTVPSENVYINNLVTGDVVTFSSENQAERHVPLHPKITRLRTDVSWKDVVSQFHRDKPPSGITSLLFLPYSSFSSSLFLSSFSDIKIGNTRLKHGKRFTTQHMRSFLESFATKRKLNPFVADTWCSLSEHDLSQAKVNPSVSQVVYFLFTLFRKDRSF